MKAPESLEALIEYGIIQEVVRPLMSGKEAQVYVVIVGGEECVAKVYKEANQRTFKHRSDYTEGRRTRNTRDQRAMNKRSQHGRKKDEDAWRSTEVEMIYRLRDAGVRVPDPLNFVEGVLVMELVKDADGHAAPRLGDLTYTPAVAREIYQKLIREVVRMLCAGVIHGDLSEFNVLMSHDGPVVIDFPQSVDPTHNANSQKLLLRDVDNLHRFLARFAPDEAVKPYGEEIWKLFQANKLQPDTELTGLHVTPEGKTDTQEVMALIDDASRDEEFRRHGRKTDDEDAFEDAKEALAARPAPFRKVVDFSKDVQPRPSPSRREGSVRRARPSGPRRSASEKPAPPTGPAAATKSKEVSTRRRRRQGGKSHRAPVRDTSEQPQRGESEKIESSTKAADSPGRRRRRGRGRARAQSEGPAKEPGVRGETTRAENPGPASDRASPPAEGARADRPPRRRRRRPRKVGSPE